MNKMTEAGEAYLNAAELMAKELGTIVSDETAAILLLRLQS